MAAPEVGNAVRAAAVSEGPPRAVDVRPGESGTRRATLRPRRVLLVEDEEMVRKVITRMLVSRGFEVRAAASGAEALALFDAEGAPRFDLLVTDLMMPDSGGLAVARALTSRQPSLEVLLVSGYSAGGLEGGTPGRYRLLTKPFSSTELARVVDELFEASSGPADEPLGRSAARSPG